MPCAMKAAEGNAACICTRPESGEGGREGGREGRREAALMPRIPCPLPRPLARISVLASLMRR